jgi:hypothetical protein
MSVEHDDDDEYVLAVMLEAVALEGPPASSSSSRSGGGSSSDSIGAPLNNRANECRCTRNAESSTGPSSGERRGRKRRASQSPGRSGRACDDGEGGMSTGGDHDHDHDHAKGMAPSYEELKRQAQQKEREMHRQRFAGALGGTEASELPTDHARDPDGQDEELAQGGRNRRAFESPGRYPQDPTEVRPPPPRSSSDDLLETTSPGENHQEPAAPESPPTPPSTNPCAEYMRSTCGSSNG